MKENVLKKFFVLTITLFVFCALSVGCQGKNNIIEYVNIVFETNGGKLKNAKGEYISGIDMSNSSFGVPFTSTSNCYSIINTSNGKNGINNKIIFAILYDLFECQGVNPSDPYRTEDDIYRSWLLTKKLASSIYVEAIMSVQEKCLFRISRNG